MLVIDHDIEFEWDVEHPPSEPPLQGPPIPVTMRRRPSQNMKSCKVACPSGIVVEMIGAAGYTGVTIIYDLVTTIIRDGQVSTDWEQSFIACLYKGKSHEGDALLGQRQLS